MLRHPDFRSLLILALLTVVGACDRGASDAGYASETGLLKFVADDTPYLFAMVEPLPDKVLDNIEPRMDKVLQSYQALIRIALRNGLEQAEYASEAEAAERERLVAVADRLIDLLSVAGMRSAGIERDSAVAIYGVGLLPVLRVELGDRGAFERTLADIETETGREMLTAKVDDVAYRYVGDDQGRLLLATVDDQLVVTVAPAALSDDGLRALLGLTLPARSIATSGRLQSIARDYGYTTHGAGFVDFAAFAGMLLDPPSGTNAEVLALLDYDVSELSAVCKAEMRGLAGIAPRLVSGYTEFSATRISSNTVLELRDDIAAGLATVTAPVPGLGGNHGGMLSFGASIDLQAARRFYEARLDAMDAAPYRCELLADLQGGVAQGRAVLEQPIPPMVYGLKGFLAVVDSIEGLDIASRQPPTAINMQFLLATDNAPGLFAMGAMFSPELATLNLQADGKPVRVESPQLQAPVEEAWVAMTPQGLAIAVGSGGDGKLGSMLKANPGSPPPAFAMDMDAGRYYKFIGEAAVAQQGEDATPEISAAVQDLMNSLGGLIDRVSLSVNFTTRGVEIPAVTTLAED